MNKQIDVISCSKFSFHQKLFLALVILDEIEAIHLDIYDQHGRLSDIRTSLRDAGLIVYEVRKMEGSDDHVCRLAIAKTEVLAMQMKDACESHNDRKIGELYGYPGTAIHAYTFGGRLQKWDFPRELKDNPLAFVFSIKGKDREIALVYHWMEVLSIHVPTQYAKLPMVKAIKTIGQRKVI